MQKNHHIWDMWVEQVHRWGVADISASVLQESSGFHVLIAQFLHISEPLINTYLSRNNIDALISIFENPEDSRYVISRLESPTKKD
jgi:hypothetical protein